MALIERRRGGMNERPPMLGTEQQAGRYDVGGADYWKALAQTYATGVMTAPHDILAAGRAAGEIWSEARNPNATNLMDHDWAQFKEFGERTMEEMRELPAGNWAADKWEATDARNEAAGVGFLPSMTAQMLAAGPVGFAKGAWRAGIGGLGRLRGASSMARGGKAVDLADELDVAIAAGDTAKAERIGTEMGLRPEDWQEVTEEGPEAAARTAETLMGRLEGDSLEPGQLRTAMRDPETGQVYAIESGVHADVLDEMRAGNLGDEGQEVAERLWADLEGRARADEEISGFIDPDGNFLTRKEASDRVGIWGEDGSRSVTAENMIEAADDMVPEPVGALARPRPVDVVDAGALSRRGKRIAQPTAPNPDLNPNRSMADLSHRELGFDGVLEHARAGNHLRRSKTGFVGGPPGVKDARTLGRMRDKYDDLVALGAPYRKWYDRGARNLEEISSSPEDAALAAREYSITSAQATPRTNQQFATEWHNARAAGRDPEVIHTGAIADELRDMERATEAGEEYAGGLKRGVYAGHLSPGRLAMHVPTNDMWQARAFGFTKDQPTATMHHFMDGEGALATERAIGNSLGGVDDWSVGEVQAAAWIAINGKGLSKIHKVSLEEGLEMAAKSYDELASFNRVNLPTEATPGAAGFRPDIDPMDPRLSFTDPETGHNILTEGFGMRGEPTIPGRGVYRNPAGEWEYNPVQGHRPLAANLPSSGPLGIQDYDAAALDAAAVTQSGMTGQNAIFWNKPYRLDETRAKAGEATGVHIRHGRDLTQEEAKSLSELGEASGIQGEYGYTSNIGPETVISDVDAGLSGGLLDRTKKLEAQMIEEGIPVGAGGLSRANVVGSKSPDVLDLTKAWEAGEGSGQVSQRIVDALDNPANVNLLENANSNVALKQKARELLEAYAEGARPGDRQDIQKLLDIIANEPEPFTRIGQILKAGNKIGLPAIAATVLGVGMGRDDEI